MHKLHKAAVLAAALGSIAILSAGTANAYAYGGAGGGQFDIRQGSQCRSHDLNVNVLGEVGIVNGLLGSALGGEGSPGAQSTPMGSRMGCNNDFGGQGGGEGGGHGGGR
ncbi:hypothetical protein K2224_27070 [Streptomyces sp. BHT-5-2]|uniref:hypothetical protein n=1 Tax=unclassified Streptomyces TaxID=2593676 RepID=UPI001C8D8EE2|nr:hypothetical protein [Streptomyces sp. BHT-5-2]QZL06382.1 hypothetical protein K2224_27070 [Streptomyces sp. BHT-5-2]